MKIRAIGVAVLLAASLTACGGVDDTDAANAIAAGLMEDAGTDLSLDQDQADCVGEGMVEKVGTVKLIDYGILTDDMEYGKLEAGGITMSKEDAASTADVFVDCVGSDFMNSLLDTQADMLPKEARECLQDKLTDDVMRNMLAASFANDQGAIGEVMAPLMACMNQKG